MATIPPLPDSLPPMQESTDAFYLMLETLQALCPGQPPIFDHENPESPGLIGVLLIVTPAQHMSILSNAPPPIANGLMVHHLHHQMRVATALLEPKTPS